MVSAGPARNEAAALTASGLTGVLEARAADGWDAYATGDGAQPSQQRFADRRWLQTSKIGMKECSRSQFRSMKVRVSEQFKEIYNPVRDETVSLSQMSGLTKLQIEEMRRRWWRESPGGNRQHE